MSYRRSYSQTIAVNYSGSVYYPKSESGGYASYNGTAYETVYVDIDVDTTPFDHSVDGCKNSVNMLTGAVAATEAAQIAVINKNAKKIAGTIIQGFFKTIQSEISQQISELSQKLDAHLLHLHEMAKSCVDKKRQMEKDYNRTSSKYLKIFNDLNKELENRIFEIDKPAFMFKKSIERHAGSAQDNEKASTAVLFGLEEGGLQAKICASIAKKRTLNAINQANVFLWKQKKLDTTINHSMLNENKAATCFLPVCFLETSDENSKIGKQVFQPDYFPPINPDELMDNFKNQHWTITGKETKDNIRRYFNSEVNQAYPANSPYEIRVKEMIVKIFDVNSIISN